MIKVLFLFFSLVSAGWTREVIEARCSIFDKDGSLIKSFSGYLCLFLEDGTHIEVDEKSVVFLDSKNIQKWKRSGLFHHEVEIDQNKKDLLVLSETSHKILGCNTRFDSINVYDLLTGKLKKTVDFYDFYSQIKVERDYSYLSKASTRKLIGKYDCSTTHVNSFSQIPKNTLEEKNSAFKEGNWIVNFGWSGLLLIFDRDFKKIVWQKNIDIEEVYYHDVQVLNDGKILLYVNDYINKSKKRVTALAEIDLSKNKKNEIKIIELKIDGKNFYQPALGSVQYLTSGEKLASVETSDAGSQIAFLDKSFNIVKRLTLFPYENSKKGQGFQQAKLLDLDMFFKNYKGE